MTEPRKPNINTAGLGIALARVIEPIKQSIEMITGARSGSREVAGLNKGCSSDEIVDKVNELIARINASGTCKVK